LIEKLAPKEREILGLASKGLTDKQISSQLSLSRGTLITYWARIKSKLNAATRGEMIAMLVRHDTQAALTAKFEESSVAGREEFGHIDREWLLDQLPEAISIWGSQNQVIFANARFASLFSASVEAFVGKAPGEFIKQEGFVGALTAHLTHTRERGGTGVATLEYASGGRSQRLDFLSVCPSGRSDVRSQWVISMAREVSSQGEAPDVIVNGVDLVVSLDSLGTVLCANEAVYRAIGRRPGTDETWTVRNLFSEGDVSRLADEIMPAAIREGVWTGAVNLYQDKLHPVPIHATFVSHRDFEGKVPRLTMIGRGDQGFSEPA